MRILFLSAWYPYPAMNGSKLRIFNLLRGLAQVHRVTLLTFTDEPAEKAPPELAALCDRVLSFRRPIYQPRSVRAVVGLFSPVPRSVVATYDPGFSAALHRELASRQYDLIIASQWDTASYVLSTVGIPAIFEELELGQLVSAIIQASGGLQRLRRQMTLFKLKWYVRRVLRRFAVCTVVSEEERDLLRRFAPEYPGVSVIPNGVDVAAHQDVTASSQSDTLIYSGATTYSANYDAMDWFIREILPLIESKRPQVRLTITGASGVRTLPSSPSVLLTGFVEDVRPLVASSWVSVVPLREGGGTRLKILESMALRTPVVATQKGVEGIAAAPGRHLLVADSPAAFAEAVVGILENPGLRQRLVDAAYELVRRQYDWSVILPHLLDLVERVTAEGPSSSPT